MFSFTEFLLERNSRVSKALLLEKLESESYWLNLNFFNYLYFIKHNQFHSQLNNGNPLKFISEKSSEKGNFENYYDYPVTLYFDKELLLDFVDSLTDKSPLTESWMITELENIDNFNLDTEEEPTVDATETQEVDTPEPPIESIPDEPETEESTEESPEEELREDPIDFIVDINTFKVDLRQHPGLLTKVELNFIPIQEMRLEKDFRDYNKLLSLRYNKSDSDMRTTIINRIKMIVSNWVNKTQRPGHTIELDIKE